MTQKQAHKERQAHRKLLKNDAIKFEGGPFSGHANLSALLEAFVGDIYLCSPDYRIEYMNQSLIRRIGHDAAGEICYKALHGFDSACPWCEGDRVFKGETLRRKLQDPADNRWYYSVSSPFIHDDGSVSRQSLVIDITESREPEEKENEERYRQLFNEMVSGSALHEVICDEAGAPVDYMYLDVNPAFEEITGLKRDDVVGKTVLEMMPDTEKYWIETYGNVALSGKSIHTENYSRSLYKFLDVSAFSPQKGRFVVTFTDVTERKLAEADLKSTTEQLAVLLESLPIVPLTCTVRDNQKITFIGGSVEGITGYKPEQFTKDPDFWVGKIHPEDKEKVLASMEEVIKKGTETVEFRLMAVDDTYKWFSCTRRLVKHEDGSNSHIVGSWQDITQEKKIKIESEARLQQVIQADKLASLGEVVAGVAHEINNPNSFIGYNLPLMAETWEVFEPILKEFGAQNSQWQHDGLSIEDLCNDMGDIIKAVKTGSDRINKVVTNLKDFARLDESDRTTAVQVNDVVTKAYEIVGAQARKHIGRIDIRLAEGLPEINGHFQKLEQVIANLIVNGAYAIPEREKGIMSISTRYIKKLNSVLIEIEDNGSGMTQEVKDKIFEPFYTTRRDSGGTGLGLSVSYGLIQEHHGKISVLSRPEHGTRFTVFLPKDRRSGKLNLQPTVLCVDDDQEILNLIKSYFVRVEEMPLETISEPEGVIEFLEEHPEVDIVLSDIRMPNMSGWELLELIRERFPLLPVFFMTGYDVRQDETSHAQGPDFLFHKPFRFEDLNNAIKSVGRLRI
jgi:PAS domain S-box-containing protein